MEVDHRTRRARIKTIHNDTSLSQKEKSRLLFDVMNPSHKQEAEPDKPFLPKETLGPYEGKLACKHYQRKVWVHPPGIKSSPGGFVACRVCHHYDRFAVRFMKCKTCLVSQRAGSSCQNPDCYSFGQEHWYYCDKCHLWEDAQKEIFHCEKCKICRAGDRNKFRHCDRCSVCVQKDMDHRCTMSSKDCCCPVCMEPLFDSRTAIRYAMCTHMFHGPCLERLLMSDFRCPLCKKSLVDMAAHWTRLDTILQDMEVPEMYQGWRTRIFCNECETSSVVPFSTEVYRCPWCKAYNCAPEGKTDELVTTITAPSDNAPTPSPPPPHTHTHR